MLSAENDIRFECHKVNKSNLYVRRDGVFNRELEDNISKKNYCQNLLYELEANPLDKYRHHKRVQGNEVVANDKMDRNVECDWNLFAIPKAASNKGIAMAFIKKRL